MGKGGIDKLSVQVCEAIDARLRSDFDRSVSRGISPIEALFDMALRSLYDFDMYAPECLTWFPGMMTEAEIDCFKLFIEPQARVLDWPVDFYIRTADYEGTRFTAVVECDGHDFHERTKEQAIRDRSRDRRLQDAGHRVFRFTGAEIYRDPQGCAREVYDWADAIWLSRLPG